MQAAVDRGLIAPESRDWALGTVTVRHPSGRTVQMTRQQIAQLMIRSGLNSTKIADAMYKDAVQSIPLIGEWWHKNIGWYNRAVFDWITPGLMVESAVRNFERLNAERPDIPVRRLANDVIRDINMFFGNTGRQGIFKNPTFADFAQIFMLAPRWVEGLVQKEVRFLSRAPGMVESGVRMGLSKVGVPVDTRTTWSQEITGRKGLPAGGVLGRGIVRGLAAYFVLAQLINLISRRKLTFQNEEEDHKFDAWIDTPDGRGVWLSPMSVFAELVHDMVRYSETEPTVARAAARLGMNKVNPIGRAINIGITQTDPMGRKLTSTGSVVGEMAKTMAPLPSASIFLSPFAKQAGYAVGKLTGTNLGEPVPSSQWVNRFLGSLGVKTQVGDTAINHTIRLAGQFMKDNNFSKATGWMEVPTDEPSYTKMRAAIRIGDVAEAQKQWEGLRKTHSQEDIDKAMKRWGEMRFTRGTEAHEQMFYHSLDPGQREIYRRALTERREMVNQYHMLRVGKIGDYR